MRMLYTAHSAGDARDYACAASADVRLEQAVDAIALEVERISEAQRFTTKLLNDQAHAALKK